MIDDWAFIFINLCNRNTENEQVTTWAKTDLILKTFDDWEKEMIIVGGDFNLFLDSLLEVEGGNSVLKESFVLILIKKHNLSNI